jgi:hypothetical protein
LQKPFKIRSFHFLVNRLYVISITG